MSDDKPRCQARVQHAYMFSTSRCSRKAKHDPDENGAPRHCGVHSLAAKRRREEKSAAKFDRVFHSRRLAWELRHAEELLADQTIRLLEAEENGTTEVFKAHVDLVLAAAKRVRDARKARDASLEDRS